MLEERETGKRETTEEGKTDRGGGDGHGVVKGDQCFGVGFPWMTLLGIRLSFGRKDCPFLVLTLRYGVR